MVKLDYDLTEELMKCSDLDALKVMHSRGVDFSTCSRLSIDDALSKIFKKKCNLNKSKAVEMLVALINGQEIPEDISDSDSHKVNYEDNSPVAKMDPVLRMQKIKERMEQIVPNMKNYYEYCKKLIKDPELKMLGATEDDLKEVTANSSVAICGEGWSTHKKYLMKRTEKNIKIAQDEGDVLYYLDEESSK